MGGRAAGTGLPDISIFRYSEPSDRAAGDPDWESGKQAFDKWFRTRGGKVLVFEEFSSPDEFGEKLRDQLDSWLTRQGGAESFDIPQPEDDWQILAAEIEAAAQGEPSIDAAAIVDTAETAVDGEGSGAAADLVAEISVDESGEIEIEPSVQQDAEPLLPGEITEPEIQADSQDLPAEPETTSAEPGDAGDVSEVEIAEPEFEAAAPDTHAVPIDEIAGADFQADTPEAVVEAFVQVEDETSIHEVSGIEPLDWEVEEVAEVEREIPAAELTEPQEPDTPDPGSAYLVAEEAGVNPQSFEAAVEEIPDPGLESGISAVNPVDPQTAVIAPEDFDAPDPQMRESDRDALSITEPKILDVPLTGVLVQEAPPKTRVRGTARTRAKSRKSLHGRAHVVAADEFPRGGLPATVATPGLEETPTPQAELFEPDAGLLPDLEAHSEPDAPIEVPESVKPSEPELFDADFIPQPAVEFVEAPVDGARLEQAWRDDSPYIRETWDGHLAPVSLPKIRPVFAAAAHPSRIVQLAFSAATVGLLATFGFQWHSAAVRADLAEQKLVSAADVASNLVFDLSQESRRLGGATNPASKDILDRAQQLQGTLVTAGSFNASDREKEADALTAASGVLFKQNKLADALRSAIQAQQKFQTLVSADPTNLDWLQRLAVSNVKVGDIYVGQNDLVEALGAYRDGLAVSKALSLKKPDDIEYRRSLAAVQQKLGDVLVVKGRLDEGLTAYGDALAIRQAFVQRDAENPDWQRDLLEIDNKIGDVLSAQSHFDDALAIYRESLAIANQMTSKLPTDTRWRGTLTLIDNKIGDVLTAKGVIDDALSTYRDGLSTVQGLAKVEPDKLEWQSLIATSHERLGDAFVAEGHLESALSAYRDALNAVKALVAKEPDGIGWQRGISETQLRIGSVLYSQGNIDGAIAAHKESLAVVKALIVKEPDNPRWRHDLMMDQNDIGLLYMTRGARADALPAYREALAVAQDMAAKDPKNTDWQSNKAMIESNIGALLMEQGNHDDALVMYRDGLTTAKALVQQDPRSGEWQSGLVVALYNLAEAGEDSEANFSLALDIIKRLDAAGALRPDKKPLIAKIEEGLAKLHHDASAPSDKKPGLHRTSS